MALPRDPGTPVRARARGDRGGRACGRRSRDDARARLRPLRRHGARGDATRCARWRPRSSRRTAAWGAKTRLRARITELWAPTSSTRRDCVAARRRRRVDARERRGRARGQNRRRIHQPPPRRDALGARRARGDRGAATKTAPHAERTTTPADDRTDSPQPTRRTGGTHADDSPKLPLHLLATALVCRSPAPNATPAPWSRTETRAACSSFDIFRQPHFGGHARPRRTRPTRCSPARARIRAARTASRRARCSDCRRTTRRTT